MPKMPKMKKTKLFLFSIWTLNAFLIFILFLSVLSGCGSDKESRPIDTEPPAAPRGVHSVTGDNQVTIIWFPNGERDLAGYKVYRSASKFEDYVMLARLSATADAYVDTEVKNGKTYFYAVAAFDRNGNESKLSPETVEDTPRPEGKNVKLVDYTLRPERSGFDFSRPEKGAQPFDIKGVDIYFGFDEAVNVTYFYSDNDTLMQDLGYTEDLYEIDVSPTKGFTELFVEVIEGHTYIFYTPEKNYAKIRVVSLTDTEVTFDWAFQLQLDNPELAPRRE